MPTKEYQIKDLKERIENLKNYYDKMEKMDSSDITLRIIIAMRIYELEERLKRLESE